MAKMVVIYSMPKDSTAFDRHYFDIHVPLAKKLAGLRKYQVSRGFIATPAGASDTYMIATLHFEDLAAIHKAFESPEGRACAQDRAVFAPADSDFRMYLFDEREV
jgi:uncharacterized protein (TIGR02118 family)